MLAAVPAGAVTEVDPGRHRAQRTRSSADILGADGSRSGRCPGGAAVIRPDPRMAGLPRHRVGRPGDGRHRAVRAPLARGLPGRPVVADDPQQARSVPDRLPRLRPGGRGPPSTRPTGRGCWPTPGSSATGRRSTPTIGNAPAFLATSRSSARSTPTSARSSRRPPARLPATATSGRHPGDDAGLGRAVDGSQAARLRGSSARRSCTRSCRASASSTTTCPGCFRYRG